MKSFLTMTIGGAILLGIAGALLSCRGNGCQADDIMLVFGGLGALFGAKFGAIGWLILTGVRAASALLAKIQ